MNYVSEYMKEITTEPYKVGDVVEIRRFDSLADYFEIEHVLHCGIGLGYDMLSYSGYDDVTAVITDIFNIGTSCHKAYRIDIDCGRYWWDNISLRKKGEAVDESVLDGIYDIEL